MTNSCMSFAVTATGRHVAHSKYSINDKTAKIITTLEDKGNNNKRISANARTLEYLENKLPIILKEEVNYWLFEKFYYKNNDLIMVIYVSRY